MLGLPELIIIVLIVFLGVIGPAFWIWVLLECINKEPLEDSNRTKWIVVVALANWLGALIYFYFRRPYRIQRYGS